MSARRTCECMTCKKCRAREWSRARYRLKAYGQWSPHGDLELVREHIAALRLDGLGIEAIADASGIGRSQVGRIARGATTRIARDTAARLLAVTPDARLRKPAWRVTRRLRALNAIGYSTRHLASLLGTNQDVISDHLVGRRQWVTTATLNAVVELYERVCMTPGGNAASCRIATGRGYAPPLAWDDIDDPDEVPGASVEAVAVDPVVVDRLLAGQRIPSTADEKREAMGRWLAMGRSEKSLCERHGWNEGRYSKRKSAA